MITPMASLKNGYVVSVTLANEIYDSLLDLQKKNYTALWNLAMKCQRASHTIAESDSFKPIQELKSRRLLNDDETVPNDVSQVVLNAITNINALENDPCSLRIEHPIAPRKQFAPLKQPCCVLL